MKMARTPGRLRSSQDISDREHRWHRTTGVPETAYYNRFSTHKSAQTSMLIIQVYLLLGLLHCDVNDYHKIIYFLSFFLLR